MNTNSVRHIRSRKTCQTPKKPRRMNEDRFIPNRDLLNIDWSEYMLKDSTAVPSKRNGIASMDCSASHEEYSSSLVDTLFPHNNGKVFSYQSSVLSSPTKSYYSQREFGSLTPTRSRKPKRRNIPNVCEKILDAPDFLDDYYLNLIDWSDDNLLAVALGTAVFVWNARNADIVELMTLKNDDYVCSVKWAAQGRYLAVGTSKGEVHLYDVPEKKLVRILKGHSGRVSSLAWNGQILSTGSRDSSIINFNVGESTPIVSVYQGHDQEVCGMKWNPEGTQLASGGNDNLLLVWDASNATNPRFTFDKHQAAVKAIEWCPHQSNLLVSGGGTADRHIRFWNTSTGTCLGEHDTKSQVCSILWSKNHRNELISSHGFSQNQLIVWEYPKMTKLTELSGHTQRVLNMTMSPDGETVVSAAADETLRFWRVFEKKNVSSCSVSKKSRGMMERCLIR